LLGRQDNKWLIEFNGCFDFNHIISAGRVELKESLSNDEKAKDTFIEKFREYEDVHNKAERLEILINQVKNAEKELKGNKLFINNDYL
jgi:hypothetical protein